MPIRHFSALDPTLDPTLTSSTERHMTRPQIYDGLGWQTRVGQLYVVQGIPAAYPVDGGSGIILAEGGDLRNEKMIPSIDKAMDMHARNLGKITDSWTPTMGGD